MRGHRLIRAVVGSTLALGSMLSAAPVLAEHDLSTALLPDLAMLQPGDFHLERKSGGKRWLRFSTTIVNIGDGAFDVYGYEPSGGAITSSSTLNVTQRLESGDGTWSNHGTTATMFYSGDGHGHWHVEGMQLWELAFEATPNNAIAKGAKTGFCFWDNVDLPEFDTAKHYEGGWACHVNGDGTQVPMGLTVGWGDKYPWNIAFQYIDFTHVPYGKYCLTLTADPNGDFVEETVGNNKTRTLINIQSGGATVLATDCAGDTTTPATTVNVADLDGLAKVKGKSGRWEALVTVTVHDDSGAAVGGATVTGAWTDAASGTVSGTTATDGTVTLSSGTIAGGTQATFTVTDVSGAGLSYDEGANSDPDSDSDGKTITVPKS